MFYQRIKWNPWLNLLWWNGKWNCTLDDGFLGWMLHNLRVSDRLPLLYVLSFTYVIQGFAAINQKATGTLLGWRIGFGWGCSVEWGREWMNGRGERGHACRGFWWHAVLAISRERLAFDLHRDQIMWMCLSKRATVRLSGCVCQSWCPSISLASSNQPTHTYMQTHTHKHTHIYIYTHTCTCTHTLGCGSAALEL